MTTSTDNTGAHGIIVFTDLDGTLLDHYSYSFEPALPAIGILRSRGIPWILCSSKTQAELLALREALGNSWPFIFENGGGVGFGLRPGWTVEEDIRVSDGVAVKSFGPARVEILGQLEPLKSRFRFRGFHDMDLDEIMQCTGLDEQGARMASRRAFTEPLLWQDSDENRVAFADRLEKAGLRCISGGRFLHVMGHFDKAGAMHWLVNAMPGTNRQTRVIALGDSDNDIGMLEYADTGVVVRSPVHDAPEVHSDPGQSGHQIAYTAQYGPAGWNRAVLDLLGTDCE